MPTATVALQRMEQSLLEGLNAERAAVGLRPLAIASELVSVARARSEDMVSLGYFNHYRPDGALAIQALLERYGVSYAWAGENIARNNYPDDQSVAVAVRDFLASPAHRANILSMHYRTVGVGLRHDPAGMKYFTIVFVGEGP